MTTDATAHWRGNEWVLAIASGACALACVPGILRGAPVDWAGYAKPFGLALVFAIVGVVYRRSGRSEPIATAALSTALLLVFTNMMATYNYTLLPVVAGRSLDPVLAEIDGWTPYRWADFVALAAAAPPLSRMLAYVYMSSLPQIACLIAVLGLTARFGALERFTSAVVFAAVVTVVFWGLAPSIGVSAYQSPGSPETEAAAGLVTGTRIGAELIDLLRDGPARIAPDAMTGIIAFPSYHTVLAVLCAWFAFGVRCLRWPFLVLNALMVPALLLHGGHYLVDVPAGIAVALGAIAASHRLHAGLERARPVRIRRGREMALAG